MKTQKDSTALVREIRFGIRRMEARVAISKHARDPASQELVASLTRLIAEARARLERLGVSQY
jgi:hypothetical protein